MNRTMIFKSRWGWMGLAESPNGIASIVLSKPSKRAVASEWGAGESGEESSSPRLRQARKQLIEYLAGKRTSFDLPLDLSKGTLFQRRVWRALQQVPYGRVSSYRQLAAAVGGKQYARAVGNAVGSNPLPIVVPCHRIVAHDGKLGGFSCGLPTKRKLLALEGSLPHVAPARGARRVASGRKSRSEPLATGPLPAWS